MQLSITDMRKVLHVHCQGFDFSIQSASPYHNAPTPDTLREALFCLTSPGQQVPVFQTSRQCCRAQDVVEFLFLLLLLDIAGLLKRSVA